MRTRVLITASVAVLLIVAGFAAVRLLGSGPSTPLAQAVSLAPADSERWTFTHWAGVRAEVGATGLGPLLDAGFDADLTSASGLLEPAALLDAEYGWSPATVEWELLAQSTRGQLTLVSLGDVEESVVTDRLDALGYERPDEDDGVWAGGPALLAGISGRTGLVGTPTLQYVAVRDGLVWLSDMEAYLQSSLDGAGSGEVPEGVADVVSAWSADPLSAIVYSGPQGCEALRMGQAAESDQAAADDLVARAGELNPYTAFGMGLLPADDGPDFEVLMRFDSDAQARTNADTRAALAAGPAPGQGGSFTDRFTVDEVAAEGSLLRMSLDPAEGAFVISDLSAGPVLFASC